MPTKIQLTKGQIAIVDDIDADLASLKWHCTAQGYAAHKIAAADGGGSLLLHRAVIARTGHPDTRKVDHKNRNRLDCTRENLRLADDVENTFNKGPQTNNKSGFKGVSWSKVGNSWIVQISANNKRKSLGYYRSSIQAALTYDRAARQMHGRFAFTNFKPDPFTNTIVRNSLLAHLNTKTPANDTQAMEQVA